MTNSQKNLITLKVLEKKSISSQVASREVTIAEIISGTDKFKDGYIVIASIEENSDNNNLVTIPSSNVIAVISASLSEYI